MTRRHFQILVVVWQLFILGYLAVDYATELPLPVELSGDPSTYASVLDQDRYPMMEMAYDAAFWTHIFIGLLAAIGLVLFRAWGRTALVVYLIFGLVITPASGLYMTTGWSTLVGYLCSLIEGGIVALAYFSPIRKMFKIRTEAEPSDAAPRIRTGSDRVFFSLSVTEKERILVVLVHVHTRSLPLPVLIRGGDLPALGGPRCL